MKKNLILTLLLLCCVTARAQWSIGIAAGYDRNNYTYEKGYAYDYRFGNKSGLEIDVPVQYNFVDWFGVRADLAYVQKGHTMHRTGNHAGEYYDMRDHYLQLPVMASFSFGGSKVRGWFNPGVYAGYWLSSHWSGVTKMANSENFGLGIYEDSGYAYYFDEKVDFLSKRDNRLDAGLTGVVGIGWRFLPNIEARLEGVCWYSLVDRASGSSNNLAPRYDTTFTGRVGFAYYFSKKGGRKK